MELPSQSGLSPRYTESDDEDSPSRSTRKSNKPLLEKKRRARINSSLEQLKGLVLDALKKDSARYSKLEKADILEMTVKHLKELQRHQMAAAMTMDPTVVTKYHSGFSECAQEVHRYLGTIDGLSTEVRMRLMGHLSNCVNQPQQAPQYAQMPGYGVPSASPVHALPGLGMRSPLPFGGLAMTSQEAAIHQMTSGMYGHVDTTISPKYHPSHHSPRDSGSLQRENSENIAPSRPLSEKTNMKRYHPSRDHGDDNNNVCAPLAKRQKLDIKQECEIELNNANRKVNINHHLVDFHVKSEPMWRPW